MPNAKDFSFPRGRCHYRIQAHAYGKQLSRGRSWSKRHLLAVHMRVYEHLRPKQANRALAKRNRMELVILPVAVFTLSSGSKCQNLN